MSHELCTIKANIYLCCVILFSVEVQVIAACVGHGALYLELIVLNQVVLNDMKTWLM